MNTIRTVSAILVIAATITTLALMGTFTDAPADFRIWN